MRIRYVLRRRVGGEVLVLDRWDGFEWTLQVRCLFFLAVRTDLPGLVENGLPVLLMMLVLFVNLTREVQTLRQTSLFVSSLLRAFMLRMWLLLNITTWLVLTMSVTCRVTITIAAPGTRVTRLWTPVLAVTLIVSAELLKTSICGRPSNACVTYRCRPRLFEILVLFRFRQLLRLLT